MDAEQRRQAEVIRRVLGLKGWRLWVVRWAVLLVSLA